MKKRYTFTIDPKIKKKAHKIAFDKDLKLSGVVESKLNEFIKENLKNAS